MICAMYVYDLTIYLRALSTDIGNNVVYIESSKLQIRSRHGLRPFIVPKTWESGVAQNQTLVEQFECAVDWAARTGRRHGGLGRRQAGKRCCGFGIEKSG